jgi:hypothetical protein
MAAGTLAASWFETRGFAALLTVTLGKSAPSRLYSAALLDFFSRAGTS